MYWTSDVNKISDCLTFCISNGILPIHIKADLSSDNSPVIRNYSTKIIDNSRKAFPQIKKTDWNKFEQFSETSANCNIPLAN